MTLTDDYDVVVVGLGPAGALAARGVAARGERVLAVDRSRFPRAKPCGSCLNARAGQTLTRAGLGPLTTSLGAVPLHELCLAAGRSRATLPLSGAVALSREALDTALVAEARAAGVEVVTGQRATWRPAADGPLDVQLAGPTGPTRVTAGLVVAAGGLGMSLPDAPPAATAARSRVGAAALLPAEALAPSELPAGRVNMAAGRHGYVGAVRLEDGRIDVAAALDPRALARVGPAGAVDAILAHASGPAPDRDALAAARWQVTPPLTRHARRLAGPGWIVVGDAAGFVEPFTGEGLAWALASGLAAGQHAGRADIETVWPGLQQQLLSGQRACRGVAAILRRPAAVRALVGLLALAPVLAAPVLRRVGHP